MADKGNFSKTPGETITGHGSAIFLGGGERVLGASKLIGP
jgi:hypothetical protein